MKTWLIAFEIQGTTEIVVQVKADTLEEAKEKASSALLETRYSIYDVDAETAKQEGCLIINEDGDEVDLEEELPDSLTLSIEDDLGLTSIDNENEVNEEIANYIDEHYPVSADDWEWEVGDDCSEIVVYNIKWNEE